MRSYFKFLYCQTISIKRLWTPISEKSAFSLTESQHIDYVTLEVRPSNKAALSLYQSMGFEQAEIKPGYYIEDNKIEDAIVLKKILHIQN